MGCGLVFFILSRNIIFSLNSYNRHNFFRVSNFDCLFFSGRGLHDGYNGRLLEFERFELKFKECLSNSAIKTKFEQHHHRGNEIITELEELLNLETQEAAVKRYLKTIIPPFYACTVHIMYMCDMQLFMLSLALILYFFCPSLLSFPLSFSLPSSLLSLPQYFSTKGVRGDLL